MVAKEISQRRERLTRKSSPPCSFQELSLSVNWPDVKQSDVGPHHFSAPYRFYGKASFFDNRCFSGDGGGIDNEGGDLK